MKKKRVVIPANMGRGIKANTALSQYEVDLTDYVDGTTVTYNSGKLGAVIPAPTPATGVKVKAVKKADGDVVITNQDDSTVEVPAIKVKATKEADGKVVITNQDGTTVEIEKSATVAGLDCAAIDVLPEKPWKKGTVLLAKQDGECVRLTAFDSIFQEVGVGITADKTNSFTNEEYKVVVTVSNTGEGKNELTNLNIVGPANTEDYEIKDVTFTKSEADAVEQVDNLTYNIRGLKKGGTVKVKYTVVPKVLGNYQFTAAVNPNSALDKDLGNNNATLILNARTKSDPTYVPSVDCPLVTATELDSSTQLIQYYKEERHYVTAAKFRGNIFANRSTLQGLKIRLDGASTVVGYNKQSSASTHGVLLTNGKSTTANYVVGDSEVLNGEFYINANSTKRGTGGYTFQDGVLTITEDLTEFGFSCRPQGNNCKWQNYTLFATIDVARKNINVSNVVGGVASTTKAIKDGYVRDDVLDGSIIIPETVKVYGSAPNIDRYHLADTIDVLTFKVKAGTAASLSYTSTNNYAVTQVRGKTTITEDTITVAADAKATDSVNTRYIKVIIEE